MEPLHLDQLCSICQTSDTPETTSSFWTLHTCVEWMSSCVSDTLGTQISSGRHGSWSLDCGPGYHPGTIDKLHLSSQLSSPPYFSGMLWLYWSQMRFWLNGSGPKVLWKQAGADFPHPESLDDKSFAWSNTHHFTTKTNPVGPGWC